MNNFEIIKKEDFGLDLTKLTRSRDKNPLKLISIHKAVQLFIMNSQEVASTISFAITITFPYDGNVIVSWEKLIGRLNIIKKLLTKIPLYSALLSIEIHKIERGLKLKKDKFNMRKESKNLAGRPHIHVCLTLFNDFMCPSTTTLTELFISELGSYVDIDFRELDKDNEKSKNFNIKNWFIYCTKELKSEKTQYFLNRYLGLKSSCFFFCGHDDCFKQCNRVVESFTKCDLSLDSIKVNSLISKFFPLIEKQRNEIVTISLFLKGLLEKNQLAIWPGQTSLGQLIPGTQASWRKWVSLSDLYTTIINFLPPIGKDVFFNMKAIHMYCREYQKLNFNYLPQLSIKSNLIELKDGIYDFQLGKISSVKEWGLTSCASSWLTYEFNNLVWPEHCLSVVERFFHDANFTLSSSEFFICKFAQLFHQKEINDTVMYVQGMPGTGKSALIQAVLKEVLGPLVVDIDNHKSAFQYSNAIHAEILLFNEFNISNYHYESLLTLMEGGEFEVNIKNVSSKLINTSDANRKKAIAISNYLAPTRGALFRRFEEVYLKPSANKFTIAEKKQFADKLLSEAVSFSVFCNIVYLSKKGYQPSIPSNWKNKNYNFNELGKSNKLKFLL